MGVRGRGGWGGGGVSLPVMLGAGEAQGVNCKGDLCALTFLYEVDTHMYTSDLNRNWLS